MQTKHGIVRGIVHKNGHVYSVQAGHALIFIVGLSTGTDSCTF
jgi:hypothetical protein